MSDKTLSFSALVGFVLVSIRKEKLLEQGAIAQKMGITQASYSRLENGKSALSVDQLYAVSKVLGITIDDLFYAISKALNQAQAQGINVISPARGSTTKSDENNPNTTATLLTGAAIGAALMGFFNNK
jgi:transcriptional regulator with XRE-family HTH domain|tara:strand:+ start:539 stop:922 length:384 start_codon:yes stop_codon:yes gene_type:complete